MVQRQDTTTLLNAQWLLYQALVDPNAVHAKGAFILCQLWALGRIADPDLVPAILGPGSQPFFKDDDVTRKIPDNFTVMSEAGIDDFVGYCRQAALNAMEASFMEPMDTSSITDPDLPAGTRNCWSLTKYNRSVFYEKNEVGNSE
ncbi:hypothetical protein FNYG_02856 [Fusarium nygamai]|uniref:Uncharacterized protein n=1 Tax=Gibberella nygamai TaxID=42673 RepID=A0A2K0WPI0_GIBNY|nr:hypothetical protein FNYG_02856 [Fusarium nygamai]